MMRTMMKGGFKKTLSGLAYHSATGKTVGNKLPSEQEILLALGD